MSPSAVSVPSLSPWWRSTRVRTASPSTPPHARQPTSPAWVPPRSRSTPSLCASWTTWRRLPAPNPPQPAWKRSWSRPGTWRLCAPLRTFRTNRAWRTSPSYLTPWSSSRPRTPAPTWSSSSNTWLWSPTPTQSRTAPPARRVRTPLPHRLRPKPLRRRRRAWSPS